MKIIQFMASEGWGGAEKSFVELANELSKEHEVTALLLRRTVYVSRFSARVRVIELQSNPTRYNPFLSFEIYSVIKDIRPDIIHTHAVKGTELVATINKFLKFDHVGTKRNVRKGKIFNKIAWVTAVSAAAKATINPARAARVEVIHNGLFPERLGKTKKNNKFTLLAIGRLDKLKGFDILIEQVCQLSFEFQLLIIGDGPEMKSLRQLIQKRGMQGKVFLKGHREDIPQLMKQAHVVVISSHSEGFCNVAVEALCYADVLISTPVGICSEILPGKFLTGQHQLGEKLADVHKRFDVYADTFTTIRKDKADDFLFSEIVSRYVDFYRQMKRDKGD